MQHFRALPPRTVSSDEYSPFYYANDHFSAPVIDTPALSNDRLVKPDSPSKSTHVKKLIQPHSSTHVLDPTLSLRSYGTCLIIGRSGTGKSTFLKTMISTQTAKRKLFLVNVRADEQNEYRHLHRGGSEKVNAITLDTLEKLSQDSTLIVEDIISMKASQQAKLREAVNYTAHHKRCKLFCVTHTVFKTGVFALMPLFNYIVFTSSRANFPIIRQTLQQFSLGRTAIELCLAKILDTIEEHQRTAASNSIHLLFFFDCSTMSLGYSKEALTPGTCVSLGPLDGRVCETNSSLSRGADVSRQATAGSDNLGAQTISLDSPIHLFFPPGSSARSQALGIYRTIVTSSTARRYLNSNSLGFSFPSRDSKKVNRISLVDYIATAISESAIPSSSILALHRFLLKKTDLPISAVKNRRLRSHGLRSN